MSAKPKPHSGMYYVEAARSGGLEVCNGKGDHYKVKGPADRGYMIIPAHAELGKGLECKVVKWLLKCGVLVTLAGVITWILL